MAEIASDELVAEIERGLADVPPGTWETDTERQEDPPYWHDEFVLLDGEGRRLCGTQNCDSHFCEVHVEFGDGPSSYWNEPARLLMEYIARMSPDNIAAILARIAAEKARADKAEADNANLTKLLSGYHQICSEAGIAPSSSEIYAAAERAGGGNG